MSGLIELVLNSKYNTSLDTSKNVKPDKPKGYLVDTPLYKVPVEYFKDLAVDTYDVVKGFNGKANDHELGKQNDVAMKLGSLAIAGYLMSFRTSKLTKLMELVGLGSFFTSMALWPKLAIALPLKMRTGIDIQQKYVDSYNRKKNFFQDPQYLPWDLYSSEQIKKIGDKMGVPYDVPNRDEVIKEKARKLSVQGNTLWMATAGFATPIATGLICGGLEHVVDNIRQKYDLRHSQKLMDSETWYSSMSVPKDKAKALEIYLTENSGAKLPQLNELIQKLAWSPRRPLLLDKRLELDLRKLLSKNIDITPDLMDIVYDSYSETLSKACITKSDIAEIFKKGQLYGSQDNFISNYKALNPNSSAITADNVIKEILYDLIDTKVGGDPAKLLKGKITPDSVKNLFDTYDRKPLDAEAIEKIKKVFGVLNNYFRRENKLIKWEEVRNISNSDSIKAYSWNRTVRELYSSMGFTSKEIDEMAKEGSKTLKIFDEKVQEIVANPDRYRKAVSKIAKRIAEFDLYTGEAARSQYRGYVDTLCDISGKAFAELGFDFVSEYISGQKTLSGSVRNAKKVFFDEAVLSERAAMYRILQILDFNKRLTDGTLKGQYEVLTANIDKALKPPYSKVVRIAKKALMEGGPDLHEAKLRVGSEKVYPEGYKTIIKLLYGVLPERYIKDSAKNLIAKTNGTTPEGIETGVRDACAFLKSYNDGFDAAYRKLLDLGYDKVQLNRLRTALDKDTIEALLEAGKGSQVDLTDNIKVYMQTFIDNVVNVVKSGELSDHHLKGSHDLTGSMKGLAGDLSDTLKKALIGNMPDATLRDAAKEISCRTKWLKRFGIGGAVLLAGTVLSTLFFGHIPQKEMYMKNGEK